MNDKSRNLNELRLKKEDVGRENMVLASQHEALYEENADLRQALGLLQSALLETASRSLKPNLRPDPFDPPPLPQSSMACMAVVFAGVAQRSSALKGSRAPKRKAGTSSACGPGLSS
jgi:hypothetical protein